jgi:hypothetical protein
MADPIEDLQSLRTMFQVPLTKDKWHGEAFTDAMTALQRALVHFTKALVGIQDHAKTASLGDQAQLLVLLKNFLTAFTLGSKMCNVETPGMEDTLCKAIAAAGMYQFATPTHTFTASAEAYLTKVPEYGTPEHGAILTWLREHEAEGLDALVKTTFEHKALEKVVRERLEGGLDLPPNIDTYIKPAVSMRRKPNRG